MHIFRTTSVAIIVVASFMLAKTARAEDAPAVGSTPRGTETVLLAEEEGIQGTIRVVERDGLRQLTINDVVQGAAPISEGHILPGRDPLVRLVSATWSSPLIVRGGRSGKSRVLADGRLGKKALVIGLGTGQTALALARAGFDVEAVELEPVVIAFARRFFDYDGSVTEAEGFLHLLTTGQSYDLIMLDASSLQDPPPHLVTREAFALMRDRLTDPQGVIAVRFLGSPADPKTQLLRDALDGRFKLLFGSGVGNEVQNLYALSSGGALNLAGGPMTGLMALTGPEGGLIHHATSPQTCLPGDGDRTPNVHVLGYLTRDQDSAQLFIDLPWYGMGAARYRLQGELSDQLSQLLQPDTEFPTRGGIGSDGALGHTLFDLLGGGGGMRSAGKFSPVIVAVEGRADVRAILHPDFTPRGVDIAPQIRFGARGLPYGGVLYNLDVSKISFSLSRKQWNKLHRKELGQLVKAARRNLTSGKLSSASEQLREYSKRLSVALGDFAPETVPFEEVGELLKCIAPEEELVRGKSAPFDRAAACDRARSCSRGWNPTGDGASLRGALLQCAMVNYRKVLSSSNYHLSLQAASRLLELLYVGNHYDESPRAEKSRERELDKLETKFPDLETMSKPPSFLVETPALRRVTEWSADSAWSGSRRTEHAEREKLAEVKKFLAAAGVSYPPRRLLLRGFKQEMEVEVWATSRDHGPLTHVASYEICDISGGLGPKRRSGDGQVPEGFYHLDYFNRASAFHLSFRVNYPNASDRLLGYVRNLGGDIMFHGNCVSIGCISMGDERIEELWLLASAMDKRNRQVNVLLLPTKDLEGAISATDDTELRDFWSNLKEGDDLFREQRVFPKFTVDENGKYHFVRR
jgi:murein L,D-transpeptidase YafK/SAM-dependent methyltransferase